MQKENGFAILIGSAAFCEKGSVLWSSNRNSPKWESIVGSPAFERYMNEYRFENWCCFITTTWVYKSKKPNDPWWKFAMAVDSFNQLCKERERTSSTQILDVSMSAWRPRMTSTGGLPNISYILRKPEPLGTEFNTCACPETGIIVACEVQRGKEGM